MWSIDPDHTYAILMGYNGLNVVHRPEPHLCDVKEAETGIKEVSWPPTLIIYSGLYWTELSTFILHFSR